MKLILPIITSLWTLTTVLSAQTIGGGYDTFFYWGGDRDDDQFAYSVDGTGDVNGDGYPDIIIGTPSDDVNGMQNAGSAQVYSGQDGTLLYEWFGTAAFNSFGHSVSAAGDVNNDGFADVIIGSPRWDYRGVADCGTVVVYSGADGTRLHQWSHNTMYNNFGWCVSGAGDTNGDGYDDLLIGTFGVDYGGNANAGAAYVFSGIDGILLHTWGGEAAGDEFGLSVSGVGDVDNDGYDDIIAGASWHAPFGAAYVYSGATGNLIYQIDGAADTPMHGRAVSDGGDINADGIPDFLVGDPLAEGAGKQGQGATFAYSGVDGSLLYRWEGWAAGDNLGSAVAAAGDFNGDGYGDVLAGAPGEDVWPTDGQGSVMVYSGRDGSMIAYWRGETAYNHLGSSLAGVGDIDRDGHDDVLMGSPWNDVGWNLDVGYAFISGLSPFMRTNTPTVSAATGGVLEFDMGFPHLAKGWDYKVLISASGTGPTNFGVQIPLTQDQMVLDTFWGNYPVPVHSGMQGVLDSSGNADASMTIPAGLPSALIGNTYYFAAIVMGPYNVASYSSEVALLTITP
jgi:hypothetical protein